MQMGPKKCPKPFILNGLERLSVFLDVFGVERGAGRPAGRADARTDGRTDAGSAPEPPPQRTQEKNTPFGANPLTPIYIYIYELYI